MKTEGLDELAERTRRIIMNLEEEWECYEDEFDLDDDKTDAERLFCASVAGGLDEVLDTLRFEP